MQYSKPGPYYQLRLERGEEIIATILEFVKKHRIKSAALIGLGAAENLVLGCYNLKQKQYRRRRFRKEHEVAALVGNIAWDQNQPICHIHAVISNKRLVTYSGHLFEAEVAATCEISILPGQKPIGRRLDPRTGLKLLELG